MGFANRPPVCVRVFFHWEVGVDILEEHECLCPYCGEAISLELDLSEPEQDYVEDCFVCCRPIVVRTRLEGDVLVVEVHQENDCF